MRYEQLFCYGLIIIEHIFFVNIKSNIYSHEDNYNKVYVFVMYNQKPAFTAGFVSLRRNCGNQAHDEVVFKWPGCGIFGTK